MLKVTSFSAATWASVSPVANHLAFAASTMKSSSACESTPSSTTGWVGAGGCWTTSAAGSCGTAGGASLSTGATGAGGSTSAETVSSLAASGPAGAAINGSDGIWTSPMLPNAVPIDTCVEPTLVFGVLLTQFAMSVALLPMPTKSSRRNVVPDVLA